MPIEISSVGILGGGVMGSGSRPTRQRRAEAGAAMRAPAALKTEVRTANLHVALTYRTAMTVDLT